MSGLSQCQRLDSSESENGQIGGLLVKASTGLCQRVTNKIVGSVTVVEAVFTCTENISVDTSKEFLSRVEQRILSGCLLFESDLQATKKYLMPKLLHYQILENALEMTRLLEIEKGFLVFFG
ncbi:unnamed protein product [Arabidopsis halleri]